jgi:transmembrane sensor
MEKGKLLLKYLNREASEEELEQIREWISESGTNKTEFAEIKNSHAFTSSKLAEGKKKGDFKKLIYQIQNKKENRFSLIRVYRIVAAVFFPVLLGISAWLFFEQLASHEEKPVYTEIIAPPKHNSQVILSDGTQVWLSPESKLTYEQNFGKINRHVKLEGEGYFEVTHNSEKPFVVDTKYVDIKVLGTSFNAEAYSVDKLVKTTLVRGSIVLSSKYLKEEAALIPGDQLTLDIVKGNATIEKVNTEIYRLVKDGLLIFKRNNLTEVCRKLERWYMVPIEYDGKGDQNILFTAKFEDESLERILKIISETIPIRYEIKDNKIIISNIKKPI